MAKFIDLKSLIIVLSVLCSAIVNSQENEEPDDYILYHQKINRAEKLFFVDRKADSSLMLYHEVFADYGFIFTKDLINAAQIAHFSDKEFKKYIERAFEFGFKFEHLKNYPLFKEELKMLKNDREMRQAYAVNRAKYVESIDFEYLDWIYHLFIQDQFDKNKTNYETSIVNSTMMTIKNKIREKGFPGDRIVGISDSTIFAEIGKPWMDLGHRAKRHEELWYVKTSDSVLSAYEIYVLLVHHHNPYGSLQDLLVKEMKKGNIHPRDIGMLYDNKYGAEKVKDGEPYFYLNTYTFYPEKLDTLQINKLRKSFYIVPLEVDRKKKEFEEKYGFVLFSGFWGCR